MRVKYSAVLTALLACSSLAAAQPAGRRPPSRPRPEDPFRFELMGPAGGGRFSAITGIPGDPRVWYIGAATGGIWKSSVRCAPVRPDFDSLPGQAIRPLAVPPSS